MLHRGRKKKILLIGFGYYLEREIFNASKYSGLEMMVFPAHKHDHDYFKALIECMVQYKPDVVLSINAQGVDTEWRILDLIEQLKAHLCIWFIDSPEHFISAPAPANDSLVLYSIERQAIPLLHAWGYKRVHYLPLAADASRFQFERDHFLPTAELQASFVGHTWILKKALCLKNRHFPRFILRRYKELGARFAAAPEPSVQDFLLREEPEFFESAKAVLDTAGRKDLAILICWEANAVRRVPMVRELLPFSPVIAGDPYWRFHFRADEAVQLHPPIGYYTHGLYEFYRHTRVNLNTSSAQLPTSTTQRAFDVPVAGGFVLSDFREQLVECFEPDKEIVLFTSNDAIAGLVEQYSNDRAAAGCIVANARKRIMAEHTYVHRLAAMVQALET